VSAIKSAMTFDAQSSIDQNLPGTCIFAIQKTLQFLVPRGCSYVDERSGMKMLLVESTLPYHLQASFTEKGLNQKSQHVSNDRRCLIA
jgi:hypothetical protein